VLTSLGAATGNSAVLSASPIPFIIVMVFFLITDGAVLTTGFGIGAAADSGLPTGEFTDGAATGLVLGKVTGMVPDGIPVVATGDGAMTGAARGVVTGGFTGAKFGDAIGEFDGDDIGKITGDELLLETSTGATDCAVAGEEIGELVGGGTG
jgi:hypothetical protein